MPFVLSPRRSFVVRPDSAAQRSVRSRHCRQQVPRQCDDVDLGRMMGGQHLNLHEKTRLHEKCLSSFLSSFLTPFSFFPSFFQEPSRQRVKLGFPAYRLNDYLPCQNGIQPKKSKGRPGTASHATGCRACPANSDPSRRLATALTRSLIGSRRAEERRNRDTTFLNFRFLV